MGISVICTCGEQFRARKDQAAQWAFCPACGMPVAVPPAKRASGAAHEPAADPGKPANSSAAEPESGGPVLVRLRRRQVDPNQSPGALWVPLEDEIKPPAEEKERRVKKRALRRAGWKLEKNWIECLVYPLRAWRLVIGLGVALGLFCLWSADVLPRFPEVMGEADATWTLCAGLLGLFFAAFAFAFLHCVLAAAAVGEYLEVSWPGRDVNQGLRSCLTWLLCFLAGPAVYAGVAWWFWLDVGDPQWVDLLILIELGLVAVDYWLLGVLAAVEKSGYFAGPQAVAELGGRLGLRAVPALLAPAALAYVPARMAVAGLEEFQQNRVAGGMVAAAAGVMGMYVATFQMRYLGLLAYWGRTGGKAGGAV